MELKRIKSIFFISLAAASTVQAVQNMTVEEAVDLALNQNTTIAQSKITSDAAKRADSHSWNSISPSLTLSGSYSQPNEKTSYDWKASGTAGISFSFSPSLFTSVAAARLNYEKGLITYEESCRSIELSVRTSFYSLLYEQEYIELEKRRLETARQQYEQNKIKYENGRISQLDVLSAQVSYEQLKPDVEDANTTFLNDLDIFKKLLNLEASSDLNLSGSLDDILPLINKNIDSENTDSWVEKSTSVRSLEKQLEAAKTAVNAARCTAYGPTVNAGWTYQPSVTSETNGKTTDGGSLSLSVSIPLDGALPWSKSADSIATAKDTVSTLEIQLSEAKRAASVSINNYTRQIKQTQSAIKSLQANVELADQTYKMSLDAYNRGTKDYLSLQDAQDSLYQAQISVKSKLYSLISTMLNLENTAGVSFGTLVK